MRSGGINWLAVIAAAIAIYALGFVIYGMLMSGQTDDGDERHDRGRTRPTAMTRMPFSPLMPILTAVFMAVLFKWGAVADAMTGVQWAMVVGARLGRSDHALRLGLWRHRHRHDDDRLRATCCSATSRPARYWAAGNRLSLGAASARRPSIRSGGDWPLRPAPPSGPRPGRSFPTGRGRLRPCGRNGRRRRSRE